ncbi:MAG: energy transducer TonB [Gemmatimonadaceae bacterium]
MFDNLIETNARKQRSVGGTLTSVVVHSGLIVLAAVATASAGDAVRPSEPEKVEFVEPQPRDEPPTPEPDPAPEPPPADAVAAPPTQKGFQVLQPPMDIPDVIPEIDLSRAPIRESDFTGTGVRHGAGDGVLGAGSPPVVDVAGTYLAFQVERQVAQLPGRGSPNYPSLLQSQGVTGRVVAQFVVDTTGHIEVGSFEVLESSHELFSAAVRRALPEMRFSPAEVGGRKVRQLVQQPFVFDIR